MLIAQISDTHILASASDLPAAQLRADCLRRCIADINQQHPDVVIFTGDTVQHGQSEEYARLRELLAPLHAPLYLIPGNRDDNEAMRAAFNDKTYLLLNGSPKNCGRQNMRCSECQTINKEWVKIFGGWASNKPTTLWALLFLMMISFVFMLACSTDKGDSITRIKNAGQISFST